MHFLIEMHEKCCCFFGAYFFIFFVICPCFSGTYWCQATRNAANKKILLLSSVKSALEFTSTLTWASSSHGTYEVFLSMERLLHHTTSFLFRWRWNRCSKMIIARSVYKYFHQAGKCLCIIFQSYLRPCAHWVFKMLLLVASPVCFFFFFFLHLNTPPCWPMCPCAHRHLGAENPPTASASRRSGGW